MLYGYPGQANLVGFKPECTSESLWSVVGLRVCISNKIPGHALVPGLGTILLTTIGLNLQAKTVLRDAASLFLELPLYHAPQGSFPACGSNRTLSLMGFLP